MMYGDKSMLEHLTQARTTQCIQNARVRLPQNYRRKFIISMRLHTIIIYSLDISFLIDVAPIELEEYKGDNLGMEVKKLRKGMQPRKR
jgi:hypothetical protein